MTVPIQNGGHEITDYLGMGNNFVTEPWELGLNGKGLILDGKLHLWGTSHPYSHKQLPDPHHDGIHGYVRGPHTEVADRKEWNDSYLNAPKFYISPDGYIDSLRTRNENKVTAEEVAALHPDLQAATGDVWKLGNAPMKVVHVDHPVDQYHGTGKPIIYDHNTDTAYVGQPSGYHSELRDAIGYSHNTQSCWRLGRDNLLDFYAFGNASEEEDPELKRRAIEALGAKDEHGFGDDEHEDQYKWYFSNFTRGVDHRGLDHWWKKKKPVTPQDAKILADYAKAADWDEDRCQKFIDSHKDEIHGSVANFKERFFTRFRRLSKIAEAAPPLRIVPMDPQKTNAGRAPDEGFAKPWEPGKMGKGIILPDGRVTHWQINPDATGFDDADGEPLHPTDYDGIDANDFRRAFWIDQSGRLTGQWGRENDGILAGVAALHPNFHTGRGWEFK